MNRYVHQIPFAAQGAFVWNRQTVHDGNPVNRGDPVNTEAFTAVRLRQMYDARIIVPAPFGETGPPAHLENGRGAADRIAQQIAAEEGKGKANAQPRPAAKPAAPRGTAPKRDVPSVGKAGSKRVGKPAKAAPKSATPKRAARAR